jgi:lipopolysaccharide transport system ATP-binding protein
MQKSSVLDMSNSISLKNVVIDVPIFSSDSFSIRKRLLGRAHGVTIKRVLDNVFLEILSGDRVGIYGPNGSGKTSLLKCIAGAYFPTSGSVSVVGDIVSLIDIHMGLDAEASGYDNIKLKLISMGLDHTNERTINEIIEFSGLRDVIHYPIKNYSSGMGIRLAFSISTCRSPEILLLDEWLSVGDKKFSKQSSTRMDELAKSSSIMIIASHDMELLKKQCNRILLLESGRVKEEV